MMLTTSCPWPTISTICGFTQAQLFSSKVLAKLAWKGSHEPAMIIIISGNGRKIQHLWSENSWNSLLVGCYPSEKYKTSEGLGWLFPRYGKIKNVPNHQTVLDMQGTHRVGGSLDRRNGKVCRVYTVSLLESWILVGILWALISKNYQKNLR